MSFTTPPEPLKYLLTKKEAKPRLIRWILLLQEFDIEIRNKKGSENVVADHLSRMVHNEESLPILETFPDEQLLSIKGYLRSLITDLEENVQEEEEEATAGIFEEVQGMAVDNRTLKELSASGLDNAAPLCIQYPTAAQGKTDEFELKSSLLHHIPKYHGLSMEDPNKHLKEFEVVCSSMTPVNVDGNILKMKAFPFSLMDKAKDWLYELAPGTVTSWESMKRAYLEKFFPTYRIILLRKKISGIQQEEGESFPTYYERFKSLVASCPQHQMKEELLLQYFYEGLLPLERQMLDASAGGALVDKTPMAAKILISNRALNAQVNIPLLDAIKQVPRYAKFLKELCTNRRRISTKEVVKVGENVSAILQRKLPPKCKDPGSFTIPCVIGNSRFESAMLDLGASINVMPYSIYASMNLGALKNDGVIIQLADRSNGYPKGVLEDVLVQVNHLIFPVDFYVLEMDESDHAPSLPILLGRPFMKTARTKIDVYNGTLTMEFDGEVINFNLSDSMKYPSENHSCFAIDVIDSLSQDHLDKLNDDALEVVIAQSMDKQNVETTTKEAHGMHDHPCAVPPNDEVIEMVAALESLPSQSGKYSDPILSSVSANKMLPSLVQPPTLELKPCLVT
ncbi:unnamed protein product [Malus baccata var. baccata]